MTSTTAPDPRRFAGLTMAECIELIEAEAADEIAAEAEARDARWPDERGEW